MIRVIFGPIYTVGITKTCFVDSEGMDLFTLLGHDRPLFNGTMESSWPKTPCKAFGAHAQHIMQMFSRLETFSSGSPLDKNQ